MDLRWLVGREYAGTAHSYRVWLGGRKYDETTKGLLYCTAYKA